MASTSSLTNAMSGLLNAARGAVVVARVVMPSWTPSMPARRQAQVIMRRQWLGWCVAPSSSVDVYRARLSYVAVQQN